jgi:GTPase Era involved in 16S rRNA processing
MSKQLYKVFDEVEFKAQQLAKSWNNFSTEISEHLPDTYQPEIQKLSSKLDEALSTLVEALRNPTLTLATTGTTSSGKSTLVNLLCGAEIVPVAVSEMSAGAVTIEYSKEKSLIIHETPGALWECGEWRGITEDRIYQRLYQVMISYIENREKQPNLACPQSTIFYHFRLVKESQLELPQGTKVKILDLPGLAYVGDRGNAEVIKQCREALCIVTYNSAETDPHKVKSLLQEVVQQVKDLGGSPARMLFTLNRIDVFRANPNWPETENRFVEKAIRDIKNELTEQFKEYTEDIEKLQVIKLSTWPALLALQIQNNDDIYSAEACKKADKNFNGLINEDILEVLPRNVHKWSRHDRNRVAEALWQESYAEEFQQHLKEHITEHFPQLVIPQAIERFNVAAGNAVTEWAVQTTTAILSSSEEHYQQECENISHIRSSVDRFLQLSNANLRKPFEKIDAKFKEVREKKSEEDLVFYIEKTLNELQTVEPYDQLGEKLYPLYGWRRELSRGINQVLEAVVESLEKGTIMLENPYLKKANASNVNLLANNLKRLVKLGYTASVAKNGETREARTNENKDKLKQLNEELNELSIHLNLVIKDVLQQISSQEIERMYQAVAELFNCHLSHLENGANNKAPNIIVRLPESQLNQVKNQLSLKLNFESGFEITPGTWKEETRSFFHWFWIVPKYNNRPSDNAKIPSIKSLFEGWRDQAGKPQVEIVDQIAQWLLEQIDCLKKNVDKIQNDILDRYQARLDKANQEITLDYEKKRNVWEPIQQKAQNIAEEFSSLGILLKEES